MKKQSASRRAFLQGGAALAASGASPGLRVMRSAHAATGTPRTLIVIHLAGGNDTLNTVVPYTDPDYYAARQLLAVPAAQVLPINAQQGLHPAMTAIKALYDRSKVAIVNGVGYPSFDYSHFQAMQIYWTADPARRTPTGWLGRSLDTAVAGVISGGGTPDVLTGAAIGSGLPQSLIGRSFGSPVLPGRASSFKLPATDDLQSVALSRILQQQPLVTNGSFNTILRNNRAAIGALATVKQAGATISSVVYPNESFAQSLQFAAQLLRVDSQIQIIAMQQGSYDTHENQYVRQATELGELSAGIGAFMSDLEATGLSGRVMILLWSEFARRVMPNASAGTDHGSAQALMLIGDGVRAGVLGSPASLKPENLVDDGNLPMTTDFRQVYATLLSGWLGLNASSILGADFGTLPILL